MPNDIPPKTLAELWFRLDKRLSLIEAAQAAHCTDHTEIEKKLDDHENRIRSGLGTSAFIAGISGLLGLIAIIRTLTL
jgi:hypothetical protein